MRIDLHGSNHAVFLPVKAAEHVKTMKGMVSLMKKGLLETRLITQAGVIAAAYCALTLLLRPFSYGQIQLRVSEALTLLPVLTPAAIPGLFIGCLLANLLGSCSVIDIVFGSLATLLAAIVTRRLREKPVLAALSPVLFNAVIVGLVLRYTLQLPLLPSMLWVGLGELGACVVIGLPLLWLLKKSRIPFLSETK